MGIQNQNQSRRMTLVPKDSGAISPIKPIVFCSFFKKNEF
ncbi:hypothetical protein LEP1GSC016_0041 [Leptospira borgpetersenii serovar Hardjo-bovis str. Sponselee]|uniref:Uncharacterized protein n=1 Tax=Leptospira borgpetersenii serovar Hardjo-bovis str. Sponselee TaxID=1303729 RepID=M6BMB7_LEPBO|nr:hypothetical protein LEP1GSC016_0041 [Leptospira borgpetersenii serovar Hardjo-bovis str. Sponselee]